jgi:hypothetical protein
MARGQDMVVNGIMLILAEPPAEIRSLSLAQNGYADRSNPMNALFGAGSQPYAFNGLGFTKKRMPWCNIKDMLT